MASSLWNIQPNSKLGWKRAAPLPPSHQHLVYYLDEFTFRFNRRKSKSRGKLFYRLVQQAVATEVTPYTEMVGRSKALRARTQPVGVT